jgi:hypothetical protein
MSKENFLIIILIIFMFYIFILPIINNNYNDTDTLENFASLNKSILSNSSLPPLPNSSLLPLPNASIHSNTSKQPNLSIPYSNDFLLNYASNVNFVDSMDSNNNYLPLNTNTVLSDNYKMNNEHCSVNCCGVNQWTPLMDPNYGPITQGLNSDYAQWVENIPSGLVGSNFSCNNGNNGNGCVCMRKNILNNLATHGGNL